MKQHADHRTVFELQHGMLGRQVAYFERFEDAQGYVRLVNEENGKDALQTLQDRVADLEQERDDAIRQRDEARFIADKKHDHLKLLRLVRSLHMNTTRLCNEVSVVANQNGPIRS